MTRAHLEPARPGFPSDLRSLVAWVGYRSRGLMLVSLLFSVGGRADDWPQWLGPQRDSIWREAGVLERFSEGKPRLRWRTPIHAGYTGPAVAGGRVFLMDRRLAPSGQNPSDPFSRSTIPGTERLLCLRENDGKLLWSVEYECSYTVSYASGPRATPTVDGDRVCFLGAEGNLHCCDVATGRVLWNLDLKARYGIRAPEWGFAGHPLVAGEKLICLAGGEGTTAVAFDKRTGREVWRALSAKEPGYCPPALITHSGRDDLIIWHPESISALNRDTGEVQWSVPFAVRAGLTIATPRLIPNDRLYVSAFYNGSLMLKLGQGAPQVLWQSKKASERDTDALHCLMSTPFFENGLIFGVCSYGQLRCLKADTGERLWETLAAATDGKETRWGNAFIVKQGERFFLFNEKGDLIIARMTAAGYEEVSRARLLDPVNTDPGRAVVWSHPAFANKSIYARNDREIVCFSLAAGE